MFILKKYIILIILIFSLIVICGGCVHFNKNITILDIKGTWEGINFGYYYLDIRENGKGYLLYTVDGDTNETYEITDIITEKGIFYIFCKNVNNSKTIKLRGHLFHKHLLMFTDAEISSNDKIDAMFLSRESVVYEMRKIVKQKVKDLESNTK